MKGVTKHAPDISDIERRLYRPLPERHSALLPRVAGDDVSLDPSCYHRRRQSLGASVGCLMIMAALSTQRNVSQ